ncbi:hypothetical protein, partial [Microbulbifer epialgicus]
MSYRTGPGVPRSLPELWQFVRREFMSIERLYTRVEKETKDAQGTADNAQDSADEAGNAAADARDQADSATQAAAEAQADADAAIADLDDIGADGQLHPSEKLRANREYNDLISEQTGIVNQATALGITTEKNKYSDEITALTDYLQGLTPTWNATDSTTPITRSTWNNKWQAVYASRQGLLNRIAAVLQDLANAAQSSADNAQTDVDKALAELDSIASDGELHPAEKLVVIREYNQLITEQAGIENQASGAGLTTEKANYSASLSSLTSYLEGLHPAWSDASATTIVSRTLWNTNWETAYNARQILLNAIAQQAREAGMVGATLQFQWDGRPTGLSWPTSTNYAGGTKYSF